MADFNLTDYKKKSDDYFNEIKAQQDQRVQDRKQNREKYAVELSDEQYASFNKAITEAQDPDEEAHKIGLAITYANQLGVSIPEAYQNVDNYNESLFGKEKSTSYRNWWTVVCDALSMGHNNVQIGQYGNELRRATKRGDEEGIKVASEAIKAYQADNELKYDNAPRSWVTNVLKNGAQSLPYTGYVAGAAMFGGLIAGPVGTAAAFLSSSELMAGQEYVDMLDAGFTHEIAAPYSLISGGLQGLVEASLGEVMSFAGAGGALLGKNVGGKLTSKAIDKTADAITKTLQTKMHFGPIKKNIVKALVEYAFNLPEEGAEEWLQSILSADVQAVAAGKENKLRAEKRTEEIDGLALEKVAGIITDEVAKELYATIKEEYPEIEIPETSDIFKEALEDFKGGVEGAIALGFIPAAGRTIGNAMHISKIANYAETMPSEAVFKQEVKKARVDEKGNVYRYSDILNADNEAELNGILSDIWEDKSKKRQETNFDTIKDFVELNGDAEGYVEAEVDEETGEEIVDQVERNEQGELDTETVVTDNEDGTSNIQYRIGTTKKEGKNLYGWIDGTFDKENNKITITKFSMNKNYEGLRQEAYEQFAADNAGVEIDWSPVTKHGKAVKEMLIQNNLNGKNRGLSYYKDVEDLADSNVRRDVAKKIRTKMTNIQSFEVPVAIAFMENLAKDRGMTLNTWFKKTFTEDFIGDEEQGKLAAEAKGDTWEDAAGATDWKVIGNEVKAIIYAGKTADLSTFVHEVTHAWQGEMSRAAAKGDQNAIQLRDKLEAAFNVKDHDWRHSEYTFKNGEVTTADEALAYGIQDFLKSGNVEDKSLADTFKQLAMFIANCINSLKDFIDLSPEIKEAYNSMLSGDDSYLAKAYRDAAKAEREIKQNEKKAADEQQKQEQKAEEEKAKETEETNFTPEEETQQQEEETQVENIPSAEEIAAEVEKQNETVMDATSEDVLQNVQDASVQEEIANGIADTVDEAIGDDLLINDNLFNEIVDKLVADETSLSEQQELITDIAEEEQNLLDDEEYDGPIFQKITSKEEIEKLNKEKTVIAYCAMQLVDGGLYPPMAKRVAGKTVDAAYIGDWFKSDEHPEIAFFHTEEHPNKKFYSLEEAGNEHPKMDIHNPTEIAWYFELKKDGKDPSGKSLGTIEARYNPYWHSSLGLLNDQFSSAYKRPNIVIVEIEIPESDLYSGYKADRAKDPVGELHWHEGPVSEKLSGTPDERIVYLSQYKKIRRVLSNAEVAERTADMIKGYDITVPDNTMTPGLLMELEKRGVKIERTNAVKKFNKLLSDMGVSLEDLQNLDIDLDEDMKMQFQQSQSWDELYNEAIPALDVYPKVEKDRIIGELTKNKDTPWYRSVIQGLLVRRDIQELMGHADADLSKLHSMLNVVNDPVNGKGEETLHKVAMGYVDCIKGGKETVELYLAQVGIIGAADKAVTAINSSTVNCHPSPECAKYCYASSGNYLYLPSTVKSELVTWYIEHYPQDAAKLTIRQFMGMPDWHINRALRLFDKGDISQEWIPYIQALNAKGIYCQIFSKNAELLHKLDPNKNILMFSVDHSNYEECLKPENLDLPLAFVYRGEEDIKYLEDNRQRYEERGGVILPVKVGQKVLSKEEVDKLPQWARRYTCPIDAGWKVLKYPKNATLEDIERLGNLWHCTNCNKDGGGVGCFAGRTVAELRQIKENILDLKGEELSERIANITDTLTEAAKLASEQGQLSDNMLQLFRNLADISNKILAGFDPEATEGSSSRFNQTNSGKPGINAARNTNNDRLQKQQRNTEVDTVRAQYENTDKWMKAPNGEATNLSENQWLQVRTPSFKNWFGDWENDPENASKVVDENGEPLVVYHGSETSGFSTFSTKEGHSKGYGNGGNERVIYFSDDKGTAKSYAGYELEETNVDFNSGILGSGVYECFLNIKNPLEKDFEERDWEGKDYLTYGIFEENKQIVDIPFEDEEEAEEYAEENNIYRYHIDHYFSGEAMWDVENELLTSDENDGAIVFNVYDDGPLDATADVATDYLVKDPNQIKSATDNIGIFDNNNPDIRYQFRAEENANAPVLTRPHFSKDNTEEQQDAAWKQLEQNVDTMKSFYTNILEDPAFKGLHVVEEDGEHELFVHENTKQDKDKNKWQISFFDKLGPWGDAHRNSVEEILKELPDYVKFVGVMWDDEKKYDKPYYDDLDKNDYDAAQKILAEYASKRGLPGPWETVITDAADITIPPTKRIENNWRTQEDFWNSGNEYSLQFQTQEELYADAMNFDNWKDFMDSYVNEFDPVALEDPLYHNQVPSDADAQWYQTVWELAHKVIPEESKNITELEEKLDKEGPIPTVMDAMFDTDMATIPGMLEDFLLKIYEIRQIDFGAPDFLNPADEEEARYFDKLQELQDFINTRLSNVTFLTQATHYATTGEITTPTRNRMLSLIEANSREYRALYSEIMENDKYAVDPEDLPRKYLEKKLRKYRLVSPNTDLERKSIDEISRLASELENRELADKISRKKLKMDDELNKLFKLLKGQVDEYQNKYDELEKETTGDYQRIANDEKRKLLKLHEQLQKLKLEVPKHHDKLQRLVDKGLKISGKYKLQVQNYKADYDEIFRKYQDLYTTVEITKEVEAALQRITDKILLKDQLNLKKKEKDIVDNLKKLRIQLVKRTMRRVPFERIDYESARTLIAIQRMLEPNMFGGVNRWIGQDSPVLREVVAYILTDEEYKKDILKYLDNHSKASKAFNDFKTLLLNTKTMQDFYKWTPAQQDAAIRYLPKDNWIKELNLKQLAKEREESIDLDIEMKQKKVAMKDENGNIVEKKDGTPYMATTFELEVAPEIASLVKDAVGEKMYYNIIARPFSEWTLEDMEELAVRVNQIYIEGRDILAAKRALEQKEAARIRERIEKAVKNTGIVINDDDTPEEKQKKQEKIDKILGLNSSLHGTKADKKKENRFNRLLHSYNDATVLRVARILDNYSDGENVNELYRKENECYNAKHRSINARAENIQKLMKENNVTEDLLAKEIIMHDVISNTDFSFTIDELLFINAANADYVDDEVKLAKEGAIPGSIEANDDYAPTSRNAVMFGNMLSSTRDLQKKEEYAEMDKQMASLIDAEDPEVMQLEALNQLDRTPGTTAYKAECKARFTQALAKANEIMQEYPALEKLAAAIAEDYAKQYDRMNEVSVKVLNSPVHRVKCYVPLVRLESNGDTNENQLKEDLLGVSGLGKEYVNKGMTKRRVSIAPLNQKPVQMGLHKTWANSVERTEHFIAYSEYVRELNRVYKSRDAQYTKNFIESRYGKEMMDYINSYINEVANPNANRVRTAGDELIRTLRGKTAPAYLAWKASAIIKQGCTSPWPYMQFVTPAEYLAASWKLTTSKGALYDAIREKSVFMKNRVMDPMNDLIKELADSNKGNKISRKLNKINEKGMAGLEWIDWICVAPGWYACYLKKFEEVNGNNNDVYTATKLRLEEENAGVEVATSKWLSAEKIEALALQAMKDDVEKQAVDYADECTRQCQPSNRATDIAPLFKNSSEAMKAYLQFQTSLNVIWNNIRYDSVYAVKNKQFFRLAGCIVGYVAAGIMMNAVMEGWPHGDDDEPEDVLKQFIFYSTTQFTDSVPMIGSALTTANQKVITGKSNYFGTSGTDMTPMVTKFINATTSASKAIQNKDDEEKAKQAWMKAASNFVDGINMNLGLPVSGLKEVGKMAGIGNKQPGLDVDFGSVYGIIDNIIDKED